MNTLKFTNNDLMPALGLGTWKSEKGEVYNAVKKAIALGYRHIDCAPIYGNQQEVGAAIKECIQEGMVTREALWVTSKLWNDAHAKDDVLPALRDTLQHLQLDYLDLFLIHWPVALKKGVSFASDGADFLSLAQVPLQETWKGMEGCLEAKLARHIGVSNFGIEALTKISTSASYAPEMNQVECHPYFQQTELRTFCQQNQIHLTSYSPLGSGDRPEAMKADDEPSLLNNRVILSIAHKHQISAAQVILTWNLQRGSAVIPKSTNAKRLAENLASTTLRLDQEDLAQIKTLDKGYRYVNGRFWLLEGAPYTYEQLWA